MKFKKIKRFKHYEMWEHRNDTYNCKVVIRKTPIYVLFDESVYHFRISSIQKNFASIEHNLIFNTFEECADEAEKWVHNNLQKAKKDDEDYTYR